MENYMIKKLLTLKGKNAQCLADKIGVSHQTVYGWQSGKAKPKPEHLIKMADVLKIDREKMFNLFYLKK